MGKTVKQHLINVMKHECYDNESAKHYGRKRITPTKGSFEERKQQKYKKFYSEEEY